MLADRPSTHNRGCTKPGTLQVSQSGGAKTPVLACGRAVVMKQLLGHRVRGSRSGFLPDGSAPRQPSKQRSVIRLIADGFRPDRWDVTGALICLVGVAIIMYAPRSPA